MCASFDIALMNFGAVVKGKNHLTCCDVKKCYVREEEEKEVDWDGFRCKLCLP